MASRGTMGGPNQSMLTLLEALEGEVFRSLAAPAPLLAIAESRNIIETGYSLGNGAILGRGARLSAAGRLAAWTRKHRDSIDVIHANNISGLNIAGLTALTWRWPLVVWSHASRISNTSARVARVWGSVLRDVRWIAVSQSAADLLERDRLAPSETAAVVPNPISPSRVVERSSSQRVKVSYLGGPAPHKGYFLLASVVELLEEEDLDWHIVVGPSARAQGQVDPATALLRKREGDNVEISDWLSAERVRDLYDETSIVFCPSFRESFGMIAAEAMANGIPVVASDIPALRELIGVDEAGRLFPPGDARSAADAIRLLAADAGLRERLGDAGRRRTLRYDARSVAETMLGIYSTVSDRARSKSG